MKTIKVSETTPLQINWLVAKCEGREFEAVESFLAYHDDDAEMRYCTDWNLTGPIIELEGMDLYCNIPTNPEHKDPAWRGSWRAKYHRCGFGTEMIYGPTALIAACRCYVVSRLGATAEVPEELT